jgi:hypothetical protein
LLGHIGEAWWLREVVVLHLNVKDIANGRGGRRKSPIFQNFQQRLAAHRLIPHQPSLARLEPGTITLAEELEGVRHGEVSDP